MQNDAVEDQISSMAAAMLQKYGVRATRFAVNQIASSSDASIATWLAIYMSLSTETVDGHQSS